MPKLSHSSFSTQAMMMRWSLVGLNVSLLLGSISVRLGYSLPLRHCLFQTLFGFPSPSCGMTRSILALSRGDWKLALAYHLFAPGLLLLCGLAGLQSVVELSRGKPLSSSYPLSLMGLYQRLMKPLSLALVGLIFLAYYGLRLYVRYQVDPLPLSSASSELWQWFVTGAKAL
jgi:hypothetical protein